MIRNNAASRKKENRRVRKMALWVLIALVAATVTTIWFSAPAGTVKADMRSQSGQVAQPGPTQEPSSPTTGSSSRVSPLIGILVLLAPFLFIAWKSRGKKAPDITATCCLPVIDEKKRPFQIPEDAMDNESTKR